MKGNSRHILAFIGLYLFSMSLFAQIEISEEDKELSFQNHFFEALKQRAIKNYKKAIVSLENCIEIDATNTAVFFEFSKNYLSLNNYQEAEMFIDLALDKGADSKHLLLHKVAVFQAQQQFDRAIRLQEEIVKTAPEQLDELVQLYIQNLQYDKANDLIETIENLGLNSTVVQGHKLFLVNRKEALEKEEIPESKGDLNLETLKSSFSSTKEYGQLIQILELEFEKELFEELYLDSKLGLDLYPSQPTLYKWNAKALNILGKYKEAIAVLTIGIDFVIENKEMEIDFYDEYSKAYKGLNDMDNEDFYNKKALELRKEI